MPCPAVLADGLFLCFDTCAHCPMLLSLIYRPIKGSAFLKPPALFPSAPSSLRGGGGGLECGAETLLSPPPAPAPRPDPITHPCTNAASLGPPRVPVPRSSTTAWETMGRDGDPGSKPLLGAFPFLFLPLHACVLPRGPAFQRRACGGRSGAPKARPGPGLCRAAGSASNPGRQTAKPAGGKPGQERHLSCVFPSIKRQQLLPLGFLGTCPSCQAPGILIFSLFLLFSLFFFFLLLYFFFLPQRISRSPAQIGSIEHLPNLTLSSLHLSIHLSN